MWRVFSVQGMVVLRFEGGTSKKNVCTSLHDQCTIIASSSTSTRIYYVTVWGIPWRWIHSSPSCFQSPLRHGTGEELRAMSSGGRLGIGPFTKLICHLDMVIVHGIGCACVITYLYSTVSTVLVGPCMVHCCNFHSGTL